MYGIQYTHLKSDSTECHDLSRCEDNADKNGQAWHLVQRDNKSSFLIGGRRCGG